MRSRELAERMEGRTMEWMALRSGQLNADIAGSIIIDDRGEVFNRLIWMQPDGQYFYYDKRHLFRMSGEDEHYTKGKEPVIIMSNGCRFKPLVCYDLRFPVWSRNKNDYDVLVYIANWPAQRRDVWLTLLKARAIENQVFTVGVNRVGKDGMGIEYRGDTMIFDAKGRMIASLEPDIPGIQSCSLDLEELNAFRVNFPAWKDSDPFNLDH
jgi:predicted amidohydrolase